MIFIPLSVIAIMLVLLTICIIILAKHKKNKIFGLLCLIISLLLPAIGMASCLANLTIGQDLNYLRLPVLISFIVGIANVILSFIIIPNGKSVESISEKEVAKENVKKMCPACNCEAEETNRVFANTTEKGKLKLGNRQWFDIYTTYKVTYKCPQCGKTWTETIKEKTGKKLKKYDKLTKTWVEYDDAIF